MAQHNYRVDLGFADFPLLSTEAARVVVSPKSEEVYHKQANKPNMYFCQNVMPYKEGFKSVGFTSLLPALDPATTIISDVRIVYCECGARAALTWDSDGNVYAIGPASTSWSAVTGAPSVPVDFSVNDVTIGTVDGLSYIWYKGIGCYTFAILTLVMTPVTLTGLAVEDIVGLAASNGYLVAYTVNAYAWSSTVDPTDFVPSTVTGAGGGNVADNDGEIQFGVSHALGVILYARANAVAAIYTGNKQYPFKLREIIGSRGGISLDLLAYEANSDAQIVYTTGGMQAVTTGKVDALLPEVTDFLAGQVFEDFDTTTLLFTQSEGNTLKKKIKLIGSRYLIISYGITEFTHALIYDLVLGKLGKIKFTHVDVFEHIGTQTDIAKQHICFLLSTGEVKYLDYLAGTDGVIVIGKLQHSRTRMTTLLEVEVENCASGTLYDLPALKGKLLETAITGTPKTVEANLKSWVFRNTAKNHNITLVGDFSLNTVLSTYTLNGRR